MDECICVRVYVCMCSCVLTYWLAGFKRTQKHSSIFNSTTHTQRERESKRLCVNRAYTEAMFVLACVCMCVCVSACMSVQKGSEQNPSDQVETLNSVKYSRRLFKSLSLAHWCVQWSSIFQSNFNSVLFIAVVLRHILCALCDRCLDIFFVVINFKSENINDVGTRK